MAVEKIEYQTTSKYSRYWNYDVYKDDTNVFFGLPKAVNIPISSDDQYFCVTDKYINRIDLVAHKFFNNSILWWVIAKANNLKDPFVLPKDTILRIPATSTLYGAEGLVRNT